MISARIPDDENERLTDLDNYHILDTIEEHEYDQITKIASEICQTPIALISLVDDKRQWFKSHHGLSASETPRELAFCSHAILTKDEPFVIADSRKDDRFFDNPLVTGAPEVIFYAGIPLITPNGSAIGTLCVIDNKPKELSRTQLDSLKALSNQVITLLELRKKNFELTSVTHLLEQRVKDLEQFSSLVVHDIKSPLGNIISLTKILKSEHFKQLDENGQDYVNLIEFSANRLKHYIEGLLHYYKGDQIVQKEKTELNVAEFFKSITSIVDANNEHQINYISTLDTFTINKPALEQILINLISNAIKYNSNDVAQINIHLSEDELFYTFKVEDNGIGIPEKHIYTIFKLFSTLGEKDRNGNHGTGIGLATVKKLISRLGGEIRVESEIGKGSVFHFTIKK